MSIAALAFFAVILLMSSPLDGSAAAVRGWEVPGVAPRAAPRWALDGDKLRRRLQLAGVTRSTCPPQLEVCKEAAARKAVAREARQQEQAARFLELKEEAQAERRRQVAAEREFRAAEVSSAGGVGGAFEELDWCWLDRAGTISLWASGFVVVTAMFAIAAVCVPCMRAPSAQVGPELEEARAEREAEAARARRRRHEASLAEEITPRLEGEFTFEVVRKWLGGREGGLLFTFSREYRRPRAAVGWPCSGSTYVSCEPPAACFTLARARLGCVSYLHTHAHAHTGMTAEERHEAVFRAFVKSKRVDHAEKRGRGGARRDPRGSKDPVARAAAKDRSVELAREVKGVWGGRGVVMGDVGSVLCSDRYAPPPPLAGPRGWAWAAFPPLFGLR